MPKISDLKRPFVFRAACVLSVLVALVAAGMLASQVRAGGDLVKFPEGYDRGVMYLSFDHAASKTYRELYTSRAAIDAAKAGTPVPSGTVITSVSYKIKLDGQGEPQKDANGRFVSTGEIAGLAVMEKHAGWGADYPPEQRNGEWEYQVFTPAKAVNGKANLGSCFQCHKPLEKTDYLFTLDKMKAAK